MGIHKGCSSLLISPFYWSNIPYRLFDFHKNLFRELKVTLLKFRVKKEVNLFPINFLEKPGYFAIYRVVNVSVLVLLYAYPSIWFPHAEACSQPFQTSNMERFVKMGNGSLLLTIFVKRYIFRCFTGFEYEPDILS